MLKGVLFKGRKGKDLLLLLLVGKRIVLAFVL